MLLISETNLEASPVEASDSSSGDQSTMSSCLCSITQGLYRDNGKEHGNCFFFYGYM